MEKSKAAELFGIKEDLVKAFNEFDPFNNNQIRGFISIKPNHLYGALIIYAVNDFVVEPQLIACTPKLHYPFGKNEEGERHYTWPKFKSISVWPKLDGTAICIWRYLDAKENPFVAFKTRLTPILKSGNFGNFLGMWQEVLEKYPHLREPACVKSGEVSLTYELHGARNPILIKYDFPLDTKLLFGVRQKDHAIVLPSEFKELEPLTAKTILASDVDITKFYNEMREQTQTDNIVNEDGSISGIEGYVFYVKTESDWIIQYKMKPQGIEEIHWVSDIIPTSSIVTTTINAVEDFDGDIKSEEFRLHIIELLKEEFSDTQISKSEQRIIKGMREGMDKLFLRKNVEDAIKKVDFRWGKKFTMRQFDTMFEKHQMSKVYGVLLELGYIKELESNEP